MAGVVIVPRGGTSRFDDDYGQLALLAPLLPAAGSTGGRGGRPEKWDRRLVLDAIFYLVRSGIVWRALPADFSPHQTVYALFRRWTRARACCRIYAAPRERARLADGRGPVSTAAVIDSQTRPRRGHRPDRQQRIRRRDPPSKPSSGPPPPGSSATASPADPVHRRSQRPLPDTRYPCELSWGLGPAWAQVGALRPSVRRHYGPMCGRTSPSATWGICSTGLW